MAMHGGEMMAQLGSGEFNVVPHAIALVIAYLLAFPIGWDRERSARSAGLRTFPLIAMASCGLIQASEALIAADPGVAGRVIQGLVTAVGFIGGGAILRMRDRVHGTATAASLFSTSVIGIAVGLDSYDVALVVTVLTVATLWILSPLKQKIVGRDAGEE
jgi:putative Mg2+ transporter-C (MgtC) family protein